MVCPPHGPARRHDLSLGSAALSGAAADRQANSALVWRRSLSVDHVLVVLSKRAARGLRVRPRLDALAQAAAASAATRRAIIRIAAALADRREPELEAARPF